MATKLTKTEAKVLIEVAAGTRAFGNGFEINALRKLADKGLVQVRIDATSTERSKHWNFGRDWKVVREVSTAATVTPAAKIERIVAQRGRDVFAAAVQGAVA